MLRVLLPKDEGTCSRFLEWRTFVWGVPCPCEWNRYGDLGSWGEPLQSWGRLSAVRGSSLNSHSLMTCLSRNSISVSGRWSTCRLSSRVATKITRSVAEPLKGNICFPPSGCRFPALTFGGSQLPVMPAPREPLPLASKETCAHTLTQTHILAQNLKKKKLTQLWKNKLKIKIKLYV